MCLFLLVALCGAGVGLLVCLNIRGFNNPLWPKDHFSGSTVVAGDHRNLSYTLQIYIIE